MMERKIISQNMKEFQISEFISENLKLVGLPIQSSSVLRSAKKS